MTQRSFLSMTPLSPPPPSDTSEAAAGDATLESVGDEVDEATAALRADSESGHGSEGPSGSESADPAE